MSPTRIAFDVVEIVKHIVSFQRHFEQAALLAAVCTHTRDILAHQLRDHYHNVQICEENHAAISMEH